MQLQWTKMSNGVQIDATCHGIMPCSGMQFDPQIAYSKPGIRQNMLHPPKYLNET